MSNQWPHLIWHFASGWCSRRCRGRVVSGAGMFGVSSLKHHQRAETWNALTGDFLKHFGLSFKKAKGKRDYRVQTCPNIPIITVGSRCQDTLDSMPPNKHICPPALSSRCNPWAFEGQGQATPGLTCPQMLTLIGWQRNGKLLKTGIGLSHWLSPNVWLLNLTFLSYCLEEFKGSLTSPLTVLIKKITLWFPKGKPLGILHWISLPTWSLLN